MGKIRLEFNVPDGDYCTGCAQEVFGDCKVFRCQELESVLTQEISENGDAGPIVRQYQKLGECKRAEIKTKSRKEATP